MARAGTRQARTSGAIAKTGRCARGSITVARARGVIISGTQTRRGAAASAVIAGLSSAHVAGAVTVRVDARVGLVGQVGAVWASSPGRVMAMRRTTKGATDRLGLALEAIVALFTAGQRAALTLKVGHAHGRKGRGSVVLGLVMMDLVDGNGGVDNGRLDSFFLDNRLDSLASWSA